MKSIELPNIEACVISVGATAKTLQELIRETSGNSDFTISNNFDAIVMQPDGGNIRFLFDGNDPTDAIGFKAINNTYFPIEEIQLSQLKLVRVGSSDIDVMISIGETQKAFN